MVEIRQVGPCKNGMVTWKKEGDSQSNARRMDRLGIIIFWGRGRGGDGGAGMGET